MLQKDICIEVFVFHFFRAYHNHVVVVGLDDKFTVRICRGPSSCTLDGYFRVCYRASAVFDNAADLKSFSALFVAYQIFLAVDADYGVCRCLVQTQRFYGFLFVVGEIEVSCPDIFSLISCSNSNSPSSLLVYSVP